MPLPDLARPARVEAKLVLLKPSTNATATVLTCPTDATVRLRTMYVANQAATAQTFTMQLVRSSVAYRLWSVSVGINQLFNCTTMDDAVYLEPGDQIQFTQATNSANNLNLFVCYEVIT